MTPDLARNEILEGIGYIPRGPETQIYSIDHTDLSLVATAEITLGGLYSGVILDAEQLPLKLCGTSHCYRTEAGAHGRATPAVRDFLRARPDYPPRLRGKILQSADMLERAARIAHGEG